MSKLGDSFVYKSKLPRRQLQNDTLPKYLPKSYNERSKLYFMHFCFAFISRMWDMGIVLLLADITDNSLFIVALSGFLSSLSIFLFMPTIGHYLDTLNRMSTVQLSLFTKLVVVSIAYLICGYLTVDGTEKTAVVSKLLLYVLPIMCAIAGLSFTTITQSIEKDWIVVLSDGESAWLSSTNAVMSQIDLGCASLAPAVTGALFLWLSVTHVATVLLVTNFASVVCLFFFMRSLYVSWPALAHRNQKVSMYPNNTLNTSAVVEDDAQQSQLNVFTSYLRRVKYYMADFLQSGCAGVMISYAFLYLTTLSFGSLMTVYVLWAGVSAHWIGICRGLAALTGFTGAVLFPSFNSFFGLYQTAQISISYQCVLVLFAASSFFWTDDRQVTVTVVIVSVLLSRMGLWMFDLSVRQIAQETIHESVRGRVNGQWKSMTAFFDMSAYAIAVLISDPENFWILTSISAAMVTLAFVTFSMSNPFCVASCRPANRDQVRSALGGGAYQVVDNYGSSSSQYYKSSNNSSGGFGEGDEDDMIELCNSKATGDK